MSYPHVLHIGDGLMQPNALASVHYQSDGLYVLSMTGSVFKVEGKGLEFLFLKLMHRRCRSIEASPAPSVGCLGEVVSFAGYGAVPRKPTACIPAFGGYVERGWLLIELSDNWHLFPWNQIYEIGRKDDWLYIFGASLYVRMWLEAGIAKDEFEAFRAGAHHARHYTKRQRATYSDIVTVDRCYAKNIQVEKIRKDSDYADKRFKDWHRMKTRPAELSIARGISGPSR
ncbi:hypothetical protein H5P28_11435 [Ruficoccus amylovorans]|uniref:Uncharacterized protein n=1 Tax=Ruficoccus amylovorans TaxID=1804625 RepID=A0A842HI18_9BACT|nr:hypothetical protein [Ruficoccus amylovorans]MBC2594871.1 hypothetical protein [Ruficoccus amylovorans]